MNKITLTPDELRASQLVQLDMLIEVDRVCRKHGIQYSISGGTLLGAVRHKGFIPWDGDADVALLREEYRKFAKIFPEATDSSKYYFQDADNTEGYRWGYGKIRRKSSLWLRDGQENMPFGQEIFIDVFAFDRLPSGRIKERLHQFHCFLIRKVLWSEVGKHTDKNPFMRFIYSILSKIPHKRVLKHYHKFADKHNVDKNHLVRVLTIPTPCGYAYGGYAGWFCELTEMEFEGHMFMAYKEYESYLRHLYGDYMTLPPESERETLSLSKFKLPDEDD